PFKGNSVSSEADIYVSADAHWVQDDDWFELAPSLSNADAQGASPVASVRYEDYIGVHGACMELLELFMPRHFPPSSSHRIETMRGFIDACIHRQHESIDLSQSLNTNGRRVTLPGNWACFQNVEHSHLYFGARRFWTDPWDCIPGSEYLCADPMSQTDVEAFVATTLAYPEPSCETAASDPIALNPVLEASSSENRCDCLPREILNMIISNLSLSDALSFCSTSKRLLRMMDSSFWHLQTLQTHACWFWELKNRPVLSPQHNWRHLLRILTRSHSQLQQGAEAYWLPTHVSEKDETILGIQEYTEPLLLPLPLGLKNRQRIWMCMEHLGVKAKWERRLLQQHSSGDSNKGKSRKARKARNRIKPS
ncbi:MAG: hypothetical protein LQ349_008814, partial [Xanthoria aureola]